MGTMDLAVLMVGTGLVLLASTVLYLIPRTATLGAILLTGLLHSPSRMQRIHDRRMVAVALVRGV
jgi:hypothetical protein